jgi:hypothetical protein
MANGRTGTDKRKAYSDTELPKKLFMSEKVREQLQYRDNDVVCYEPFRCLLSGTSNTNSFLSLHRMSSNRTITAQGRVFGLNSNRRCPINTRPKDNIYEYEGIFRLLMELLRISEVNHWYFIPRVHQDPHHYGKVGVLLCLSQNQLMGLLGHRGHVT